MSETTNKTKYIDKDPPMLTGPDTEESIIDYLAYLKEQINFALSTFSRRVNAFSKADYIVEEGLAAVSFTWYYRKWSSGYCECWHRGRFTRAVANWSAYGDAYACTPTAIQDYPFAFASQPFEFVQCQGNEPGWLVNAGNDTGPSLTGSGRYRIMRTDMPSASVTYTIDYYVRGMLL